MTWIALFNPPAKKGGRKGVAKKKAKKKNPRGKPKTATGKAYRKIVKKYGVTEGAKVWRKMKRAQKVSGKKAKARPKTKGGKSMAKKSGGPKTYRAMVKKYGVTKGAKMWRAKKRKPAKARKARKKATRKRASNPKGTPKTARGKAYRALVKKMGVTKAAKAWRASGHKARKPAKKARKRYAANAWKGQKKDHGIASMAGWARKKGVSVPVYLRQRGVSKAKIDAYIGKHGAVGGKKRSYTKSYPLPRGRKYASNPVATVKEVAMSVASKEGFVNAASVAGGMLAAVVGGAVVSKLAKAEDKSVNVKLAIGVSGEILGSVIAGAGVAVGTKKLNRGLVVTAGGVGFSLFKLAYNKLIAGRDIFGVTLPGEMSDYVEFPAVSDYVAIPETAGMGQAYGTGMEQFLPVEQAEAGIEGVGQFIPEQFGEYTVGLGDEADVEY